MNVESAVLLRNATVFDGTGTGPEAGLDLLVTGERVAAVGRGIEAPAGAETIDLGGRTVMPGLIDCHVHLMFTGNPGDVARMPSAPAAAVARDTAENARRTLEAGVTSVRDLGSMHSASIQLREAIERGRAPGPRIRAAGQAITMTGGHGHFMGREVTGADDARRAVREQLKAGADAIKLVATGGVMTPRGDPRSAQLTEEEICAAVEEAHKAFVRVAAHAQANAGIKNAVRGGVDSIEHGIYLDDEVVGEMKERGTFLVPTLIAPASISRHGIAAGAPAYMVEKADRVLEAHRESFRLAYRWGVRIAMGTDAGTPFNHHGANAEEIALMVECGMSPGDALVAATHDAAELLGILDTTGTVEEGKLADLLVVEGDPLADVRLLCDRSQVPGVLARGRWVRRGPPLRSGS